MAGTGGSRHSFRSWKLSADNGRIVLGMAEERGWGGVERDDEGNIARLAFTVPGPPKTWQRARRGSRGPLFTPADVENKMSEVRDSWRSLDVPPFAKDVFLAMAVCVFIDRPASHFGTGRNAHLLKPSAPARPGFGKYGGDLDNFAKLVKDALNAVAFHDDSQIAAYLTPFGKWFTDDGSMPRTEVVLEPIQTVALAEVAGQEALIAA